MTIPELANGMIAILIRGPGEPSSFLPKALKRDDWRAMHHRNRDGKLQPDKNWFLDGPTVTQLSWQDIDDCYLSLGYEVYLIGDKAE